MKATLPLMLLLSGCLNGASSNTVGESNILELHQPTPSDRARPVSVLPLHSVACCWSLSLSLSFFCLLMCALLVNNALARIHRSTMCTQCIGPWWDLSAHGTVLALATKRTYVCVLTVLYSNPPTCCMLTLASSERADSSYNPITSGVTIHPATIPPNRLVCDL